MILAVVHNLPPGGQKRALYYQLKELSKKHKIDLFCPSTSIEKYYPLENFCHKKYVFNLNYQQNFPFSLYTIYYSLPEVYKKIANIINNCNYDVAYVNPCFFTQAPYVLKYLKIPSLYFCPEPKREFYEDIPRVSNDFTYKLTFPFRYPIKKIDFDNTRHASLVITNSYFSQKKIEKIYKIKCLVNYLGVDLDLFKPIKVKKKNYVLSVGELSLHKGLDFLIKSIANIDEQVRPELLVIGHQGSEKNYLINLAKNLRVTLLIKENINDQELAMYYNQAIAFVYASLQEPFGMVLLEALSCGLFIIAVAEGGTVEIIKNKNLGILIDRNEIKFTKVIESFLKNKNLNKDIDYQRTYLQKYWNWKKSVKNLEDYLKITAKKIK